MNSYPKHYLADVPQELRLRVLDLCIHRQWHDALDLLHQNGFTQYEWWEVVWFHDHAPTDLPHVDCGGSTPLLLTDSQISNAKSQIVPLFGLPPSGGPNRDSSLNTPPASRTQEPASETLTPSQIQNPKSKIANLKAPAPDLNAASPCCSVISASSVLRSARPRSKIARLPRPIQHHLNTMLAAGCPYMDIIRNLNAQGYPGLNKVNLHTWKLTGFQNWLRAKTQELVT